MDQGANKSQLSPTAQPIIFGLPASSSSSSNSPTSPSHSSASYLASTTTMMPLGNAVCIPSPPSPVNSMLQPLKVAGHDPLHSPDWDKAGPPGILCSHRVKKDLKSIFIDPLPGIFIVPREDNLFTIHSLIVGPFDTPYEGGFFHFIIRFGPQYPLHPPRVKLMTTGQGRVRFNPNLYKNGKVCLSILGTWSGPSWSPASNLSSVLLSLQSLLNEKPYHNEPGYEKEHQLGDVEKYNHIIMHETIRVSVLEQLTDPGLPDEIKVLMKSVFIDYYDHYVEVCKNNLDYDGLTMQDPFHENRGTYQFGTMLKTLEKLKGAITSNGIPPVPNVTPVTSNLVPEPADEGEGSSVSLSEGNTGQSDIDDIDDGLDDEEEKEEEEQGDEEITVTVSSGEGFEE